MELCAILTNFVKHEFLLIFLEELRGSRLVKEQGIDSFDVINTDFCSLRSQET